MNAVVSVPSRGIVFLNYFTFNKKQCIYEFPSPLGELSFLTYVCQLSDNEQNVSVPSRGIVFLNIS